MYKKTAILITSYIKSIIENIEVFDATINFKEPENYSAFYIIGIKPTSPFENFIGSEQINEDEKTFTFKKTKYVTVRVDFRGDDCYSNMESFENSFLQEDSKEFLKEAGFGFLGIGDVSPITSLRDVKVKQGLTTTIKLIRDDLVIDTRQIIKHIDIKVSNNLIKG